MAKEIFKSTVEEVRRNAMMADRVSLLADALRENRITPEKAAEIILSLRAQYTNEPSPYIGQVSGNWLTIAIMDDASVVIRK